LPQIFFQFKYFLKDPIEYDVKYQVGRMGRKEEESFYRTKCFLLSCSVAAGKSSSGMLFPGVLRIIIIAYFPFHAHDSLLYQHARFALAGECAAFPCAGHLDDGIGCGSP
jgi:hypothetical protein